MVAAPATPAGDGVISGLHLIQLSGAPTPEMRSQLRSLGVELLRYVPEDAFVARLEKANPAELHNLPFVRWHGDYKPSYKVQTRLRATQKSSPSAPLDVAILMTPDASEADVTRTKGLFQSLAQESQSRFGRILRGRLSGPQLNALERSDSVLWIEPQPRMKLFDEVSSKIVAGDGGPNVLLTQSLGYDGTGVNVAVADSGLNNGDALTMHPDLSGRTPAFFFYGSLFDAADEHSHGTHVAGIIAGNGAVGGTDEFGNLYGLGVAPGASIIAQRLFDANGNYEPPPSFERMTRDATRAGADIGSNSWGEDTQGRYDLSAAEFDALVRDADALLAGDQQYILEFSAGNAGPGEQTIGSPAVAKNVIATGASQNDRVDFFIYDDGIDGMADFSSRGPCEDGRIKPDLVAPGTWIASLLSASGTDLYAWAEISSSYIYQGGTSQAGPHVSGGAAVFVQYYRLAHGNATPSPALVKAALINSAADMADPSQTAPVPNNNEGWGRLDLARLLGSDVNFDFVDQSALLTNGQTYERHVLVAVSDEPFKVTLTYTDVPGFPGAIPALVNDLDLEVIAPNGLIYHGNQFEQGESVPGAPGRDNINNVEGVLISNPLPGHYLVRVRARNVVADARAFDTPGVDDQDFALVSSGLLAEPGESLVFLNRRAFRAPSRMNITVVDPDLTNSATVSVLVRSTTESAGETYALSASALSGTYTGSVATVIGGPSVDSQLQIAHGDTIEVQYFDSSAGVTRSATAMGDVVPPVLSNVHVTNQFGRTVVRWNSNEPADSLVRFDTNTAVAETISSATLVTSHAVRLGGLVPGTNYYFLVVSADEAGNNTTNDNGGALFTFVSPPHPTVLLVEDWTFDFFSIPPLSGYMDPLNALGVSYDIWSTDSEGSPTVNDLLPYRVVIWRLPEFNGSDTWSSTEQGALAQYLASGGSLFVASMQVLSRLETNHFGAFAKTTLKVKSYETDAQVPEITGAPNDPISSGISLLLDHSVYHDESKELQGIPDDVSDTITPSPVAAPIFFNDTGSPCGLRFPRIGENSLARVVFLSFPLDSVPFTEDATNNRTALLGGILRFLAPGFDGRATIALNSAAYTIPSQLTIEVDEPDLGGAGTINVSVKSDTQPAPISVVLQETPRRGTFRGSVSLVDATNAFAPAVLRVQHGDVVRAEYFDVSASQTVGVSAIVDTEVPLVANVTAEPSYVESTITWATSKPCDALVQYGESLLSLRTVYDPTLTVDHQIVTPNLSPDTVYYFRVVSRDAAGNVVASPPGLTNLAAMHAFTTLVPLSPPWCDNMDGSSPGWTVFNSDTTQTHWTRGQPNNGVETDGHSSPNAWGSNLNGDSLDDADTFLISPTIHLSGGNTARLRFWHNYDFLEQTGSDAYQWGFIYLITNNLGSAIELMPFPYDGSSFGWEEVEIDLTPYIGQVVNIVWHHTLFALEAAPRAGWLIDDVCVIVTNEPTGTIVISNNLAQALFALSGPTARAGSGMVFTVTNAVAGDYTLEYRDVPYYNTPWPQFGMLPPGGTLEFYGQYTFTDDNANSIPDPYELQYFGEVSFERTSTTDTDGDGVSDLDEFLAGTDPNSPLPPFQLTARMLDETAVMLEWPAAPGHSYRVHTSTNFINWTPLSGWIVASNAFTNFVVSGVSDAVPQYFRVEATDP